MSCTFAHNTNLSLISWLPESLETELSAFHQLDFFPFFLLPQLVCDKAYRATAYIKGSGIFTYLDAALLSRPASGTYWQPALVMAG